MKLQHVLAASAAFAASVWSGYEYAKPLKSLPPADGHGGGSDADAGAGAFDRLAPVYDAVVGREERFMLYGLMRWWLTTNAKGDVLEISAGTGRNLDHYSYSSVDSLTLADVSAPMLQRAQAKFFDELQLQYKQPQLAVKFVLADAEHMVAADGRTPVTVQLPPARVLRPGVRSAGSPAAAAAAATSSEPEQQQIPDAATGSSIWRFKNKQQHSTTTSSSSSAAAGGDDAHSTATSSSSSSSAADDGRRCGNDTDDGSTSPSSSSGNSSTGNGWWWRRQQQQGSEPDAGCTCSRSHSAAPAGSGSGASEQLSTFAPGSFDTVVDTFGLCSCRDPVQALRQAALLLKPGGRLLLLEHGSSSWDFLNRHMAERATAHYRTYGCWYNRDILAIVQQAGLEVQSASRWHWGTSYMIVATAPATPKL